MERNYYNMYGVVGDDDVYGRMFGRAGTLGFNWNSFYGGYWVSTETTSYSPGRATSLDPSPEGTTTTTTSRFWVWDSGDDGTMGQRNSEAQQAGPGDLSWGNASVDPNSFNLARIGDAFYTNASFSESMWVVKATNIIRMKKSYIKLDFQGINLMVRARQDDGSGKWKSTQEAREDLTWAFNIARFLLFEDLKAGRIESNSEARERFMDYLNGPLVRADLYPYRGFIPKSNVTFIPFIGIWPN